MKSKIIQHLNYTVTIFVDSLRHDISKPMRLKHYKILEEAFHDASKIEEDLEEEKAYKA